MTRPDPGRTLPARTLTALLTLLVTLAFPRLSLAQNGQDTGEIQVSVAQYGLGNSPRAGDWAGVQVEILDSAPEQREVILRLAVRDADGDRALYDRVVTANPGVEQSFWLYARLPYAASDEPPGVLVFEAVESGEGASAAYRAGRLLGRFDPTSSTGGAILPPSLGLIGVVGPYGAGVEQYGISVSNRTWQPMGHELTRIATGLDAARLPDRWQGLAPFEVLVWGESTTRETEPSALTPEQSRAIRSWVQRGGHLVILLPPAGDPWFGASHSLTDLLPDIARPERRDGVNLDTLRPLLTESIDVPLPANSVVHTFTPRAGAEPTAAQRVLSTPDGACIAVRRIFGSGAVTVVGLDLNAGPLRRYGLPDAEPLWHRVLGRRGDIRRPEELSEQEKADAGNSRRELDYDHDISSQIDRTGRAVQGVLFGLLVFISYWAIAGPLGFFALRKRNLHQHAWVAFVAATAAFTGLAWAGASVLRPKRVSYTHLTLLEFVQGQENARARTWASVMLPDYGQSTLSVAPPDAPTGPQGPSDLIAPWEPSGNLIGWNKGFPDNSSYAVEAARPSSLPVPTRATIKQVQTDTYGVTAWKMPALQRDPASLADPVITREGARLTGVLFHELPAPMTEVRVFICPGQVRLRPPGSRLGGEPIAPVSVLAPVFDDRAWNPGEPLDLGIISNAAAAQQTRSFDYFRTAARTGVASGEIGPSSAGSLTERLLAARFISQFAPPNFRDERDPVATRLARRVSTHTWDLGRWVTTPCVIVTGFVEISANDASPEGAPFPMFVDGRAAPASGRTMVTCIYPLADAPPVWWNAAVDAANPEPVNPPAPTPAADEDASEDE